MSILSEIQQLKEQGLSEGDITKSLQDRGYSPVEINQGLEQSKIKSVIAGPESQNPDQPQQTNEMQPSIVEQEPQEGYQEYPAYPQGEGEYQPETPQYESSQQQQYQQSPEVISEIADQLFTEKTQGIKESIHVLTEMKLKTERKLTDLEDRIKRLESLIDSLQQSIITRTGKYFEDITEIKNEMGMMQDSFSKSLKPMIDELRK